MRKAKIPNQFIKYAVPGATNGVKIFVLRGFSEVWRYADLIYDWGDKIY